MHPYEERHFDDGRPLRLPNGPKARPRGDDTSTRQIPSTRQGAGVKTSCLAPRSPSGMGRERRSRWGGVGACLSTETTAPDNPVPPRKGFFVLFGLQNGRSRSGLVFTEMNDDPRYKHSGMTMSLGRIHHIALAQRADKPGCAGAKRRPAKSQAPAKGPA